MAKLGVVLLNLGAPATLNDIRPFLRALFSDRDLFPWFFRAFLAPPIAMVRAIQDRPQYRAIGGGSPLGATTQTQADLLKAALPLELHANVYVGMRYSPPTISDALLQAMKDGVETLLLLPLYPQYSLTTTYSSLKEVERQKDRLGFKPKAVHVVRNYPTQEDFIEAHRLRIQEALETLPPPTPERFGLVFSAHGIPLSFVKKGDPYPSEVKRTMEAVLKALQEKGPMDASFLERAHIRLSFQSKVGPVRWLAPSTIETVRKLGQEGVKSVLVVPVSFVSDHMETLYELGIQLKKEALGAGIPNFRVAQGLNNSPSFILALAKLTMKALEDAA